MFPLRRSNRYYQRQQHAYNRYQNPYNQQYQQAQAQPQQQHPYYTTAQQQPYPYYNATPYGQYSYPPAQQPLPQQQKSGIDFKKIGDGVQQVSGFVGQINPLLGMFSGLFK